jgi:hypothetical protein
MNVPWWRTTGATAPTPNEGRRGEEEGQGGLGFDLDNKDISQNNEWDDDNDNFSLTGEKEGQQGQGTTQQGNVINAWLLPPGMPPTQQVTKMGTGVSGNVPGGGNPAPSGGRTYSGILSTIRTASRRQTQTLTSELNWQAQINGDAAKITAFKETVVEQQKLMAFIFMRVDSPTVTLVHGVSKYCSFNTAIPMAIQGKIIAFVGDRTERSNPVPILLPQSKAWEWKQAEISMDIDAMTAHYTGNPDKWGKLWTPAQDADNEEVQVPRLLHISLALVALMKEKGGQSTPGDVLQLVMEQFGTQNGSNATRLPS